MHQKYFQGLSHCADHGCMLDHFKRAEKKSAFHQLKRLPSPHNPANRLWNEAIPTVLAGRPRR